MRIVQQSKAQNIQGFVFVANSEKPFNNVKNFIAITHKLFTISFFFSLVVKHGLLPPALQRGKGRMQ